MGVLKRQTLSFLFIAAGLFVGADADAVVPSSRDGYAALRLEGLPAFPQPKTLLDIFKQGDTELASNMPFEAERCFMQVLTVDPYDWEARERLVLIYQALGLQEKRDANLDILRRLFFSGRAWKSYIAREQFIYRGKFVHALEIVALDAPGRRVVLFLISEMDTGRDLGAITVRRSQYPTPAGSPSSDSGDAAKYQLLVSWKSGWRTSMVSDRKPGYSDMKSIVTRILDQN